MITVKVIYSGAGKPAKGERVAIGFSSLGRGVTDSEYTNEDGEAHFDVDPGEGEVYVNGSSKHKGNLRGKVTVYI
jgi:hypothetical protein